MNGIRVSGILLAVAALSFGAASAIHFGLAIPLGIVTVSDPFSGAAMPEAVLGVACAAGAACLLVAIPPRLLVAVGVTAFSIAVTLYGLSVTLGSRRTADMVYHLGVLAVLALSLLLALHAWRRQTSPAEGAMPAGE